MITLFLFMACNDTSVDTANTEETTQIDGSCIDETDPDIGQAIEINEELHSDGWFFVYLDDMTTDHTGDGNYTFMMQMSAPVPTVSLGSGVTGINLGPDLDFNDVDVAPTEGYLSDGADAESLIVGTTWQNGGSGSSGDGFVMSENIYVLRTTNNHFGKVEFLSAKSGAVSLRAYLQNDEASCNIRTSE